jgi:hypothetical protein
MRLLAVREDGRTAKLVWKMLLVVDRIRILSPLRAERCCPTAAVRQPGYLPYIGGP